MADASGGSCPPLKNLAMHINSLVLLDLKLQDEQTPSPLSKT